ncbi:MAG: glucose 1-dehydrogenase [Rhizobiales bacterium]|nr:glucose 1-dehydrogenase [Hyphomicrobiales bacterium]
MPKLQGKTAIITGAGGGIGGAIARLYAAEGARVACVDIDAEGAAKTVHDIEEKGGTAIACVNDVSRAAEAAKAVSLTRNAFGSIDILVNSVATITPRVSVVDLSEEDWDRAFAVNIKSVFLMCKHAIPSMIAAGGGSIVIIASNFGHVSLPGRAAYSATKGGLLSMTRALALDHVGQNIRVNSISPGSIETDRGRRQYGSLEQMRRERAHVHPIGRMGVPDEVAYAALFLACHESSFMTGADMLIDGGYTAR